MLYAEEDSAKLQLYYLLHAKPKQYGVQMKPSSIPNAGLGLFTTKSFAKGELVCEYMGIPYTSLEALHLPDKTYLMRLGDGKFIDALHAPQVYARYINDCRSRAPGHNVRFVKIPRDEKANVIALRDISAGEELFVDYGKLYWLAYNLMHPEAPVR